ncbi:MULTISPECIES: BTAD domain-containing putative transcriptional regulator [Leptospira]|uniref:BTAD domain-containing putative transcriptional regulator n=1 Tax=Leptospira TaxID=171 RepID=UPI0002BDA74E|nr:MULTISPECIES: BTAD domain-containing putative transcriptional regulator [Leptospira]EMJ92483.1 bacterial transcriptional activator domain protein [Leptospira kirschneri str. JB]EMK06088.1 bacterial transcriptional activator domain protein [Leptospira kirschneri]KXZ26342.1 transcriptional regulator [Leptospira kirschneri]KXZ30957.1 transcriptional regulator [Leptospira sp. ZV016]
MDITLYQIFCYLVATVFIFKAFYNLFLYYKNRNQIHLLHFTFLQIAYGLYILFFTQTINTANAEEALIWERLKDIVLPIFGIFLILFVNSYLKIFSTDFLYFYMLLNLLLSVAILFDFNSYHIGLLHEKKFPSLGIIIYETDQPILVNYLYVSRILTIFWILFKVITQFIHNLFKNLFLFIGLTLFCANALLDILVAINLVSFPYTSHFSFLILSFSVDLFLKSNSFERKSKEELKQILTPSKKLTVFSFLTKVKTIKYENQKEKTHQIEINSPPSEKNLFFIRTLGNLELERRGIRIPQKEISTKKKMLKLVKILLIRFEKGIHREELLELLWPEMSEKKALNSLHALCFRLRKIIGNSEALVFSEDRLFFRQDLVQTDFQLFEKHYQIGTKSIRQGDTESAIQEFRCARKFYRGVFFEFDLYFPESEIRREYIRKSLIEIFQFLCEKDSEKNEIEKLLDDSANWIYLDDLDERAWRFHFEALFQLNRKNEALRKYKEFKKSLKKELDIEPESATFNLIEKIRSGEVSRV